MLVLSDRSGLGVYILFIIIISVVIVCLYSTLFYVLCFRHFCFAFYGPVGLNKIILSYSLENNKVAWLQLFNKIVTYVVEWAVQCSQCFEYWTAVD